MLAAPGADAREPDQGWLPRMLGGMDEWDPSSNVIFSAVHSEDSSASGQGHVPSGGRGERASDANLSDGAPPA